MENIIFEIRVRGESLKDNFKQRILTILLPSIFGISPFIVAYFFNSSVSDNIIIWCFFIGFLIMFYTYKYPFIKSIVKIDKDGINLNNKLYKWENIKKIELELEDEVQDKGRSIIFNIQLTDEILVFYMNNSFFNGWEKKFHRFMMAVNYFSDDALLINKEEVMKVYLAKGMKRKI